MYTNLILKLECEKHSIEGVITLYKIFGSTKLKSSADDMTDVSITKIPVFDRIYYIMGNGENAGNQHFLLFRCLHKLSS